MQGLNPLPIARFTAFHGKMTVGLYFQSGVFMSVVSEWFKKVFIPRPGRCDVDPGVDGLLAVIRITAKLGKGVAVFLSGRPALAILLTLGGSIVPDLIKLLEEYSDIPCEVDALTPERYAELLAAVAEEFGLSKKDAKSTIEAALSLVTDLKRTPIH